jgi:hypothetical protein
MPTNNETGSRPRESSPEPRLVVHIGFHKTGSSAIQESLHQSSVSLHQQGVIYPEPTTRHPSHLDLAASLGFADYININLPADAASTIDRYRHILGDLGPGQTGVLSSEEFCNANYNPVAFGELKRLLDDIGIEVMVVAFTRPPIDFLTSLYHHYVAAIGADDFLTWLDVDTLQSSNFLKVDLNRRLEIWRQSFADVRVADYAEFSRSGESAITAFLRVAELDCAVAAPDLRSNVGLHPYVVDAVRGLRKAGVDEVEFREWLRTLRELGGRLPPADPVEHYLGEGGKDSLQKMIREAISSPPGR